MFKKISLVPFVLLVAISATACGAIQPPATTPTDTQPSVALAPAAGNAPDQSAQNAPSTAPGSGPQAGQNGKGGKPGKGEAALLQMLNRLGWEGGVITKISSDQISLRTIERPGLSGNSGQNQPGQNGQNQPGQNQPGQKRPDLGRVTTVNINSSTIILVPGKSTATLSDLHVGDRVMADVPKGQKIAALVMGTPKELNKDNIALGMVTGNANGTLTLRTPGGGDTVNTTSTTQVFKLTRDAVTPGSVSDVQNGNLIFALGTGNNDNFNAQVIFALPKGALEQGKGLGNGKKNNQPQQPTPPNSGG